MVSVDAIVVVLYDIVPDVEKTLKLGIEGEPITVNYTD